MRRLTERDNHRYWGCSDCQWTCGMLDSGALQGLTLDEMMQSAREDARMKFAAHVCSDYPNDRRPIVKPKEAT